MRRLAREAGFVFRARVHVHGAIDAPTLPAGGGEPVIVDIEHALRGTEVLRGLAGQQAVVLTHHAAALREHRAVILFAECISLGQRLLLRELGHVEVSAEADHEIAEALRVEEDRPLHERLAEAPLVVVGEVRESRALAEPPPPHSEHDPEWWIARVAVRAALKGRKPAGDIEVLFANSIDIAWYKSPKLHRGVGGIFVLRPARREEAPKDAPRAAYQMTDPLDLLPADRLSAIERLIGREGGGR